MLKNRALMGLLIVAIAATGFCIWHWQSPTDVPPAPFDNSGLNAGNRTEHDQATSIVTAGSQATNATTDAPSPPPVRIEVRGSDRADPRPCKIRLTLQSQLDGKRTPLPFVDVAIQVSGDGSPGSGSPRSGSPRSGSSTRGPRSIAKAMRQHATNRTNSRGVAEFSIVGGDGQTVHAVACLGGAVSAVLTAGQTTNIELVVTPTMVATGRVVDEQSVGIAGADIVLLPWPAARPIANDGGAGSGGQTWRIARSGPDGHFFVPLGVGNRIGATHHGYSSSAMYLLQPGHAKARTVPSRTVPSQTVPSQTIPTQTFELLLRQNVAKVIGMVRDSQGRPLADAEVELRTAIAVPFGAELAGPPSQVRSQDDGSFSAFGLAPGPVRWSARKPGYGWHQGTTELLANANNRMHIVLPPAASITGKVVRSSANNSSANNNNNNNGSSIAGATVCAGQPGTLAYVETRSGPDGSFRLDGIGHGKIHVQAQHLGRSVQAELALPRGGTTEWRAQLNLNDNESLLRGVVVDANKRPLSGWTVVVRQQDLAPRSRDTDQDGRFSIAVKQANDLDVRVYAPGRPVTSFADARLRSASTRTPIRLQVQGGGNSSLTGRVVIDGSSGVPAKIGCWHHERREYARFIANNDGYFDIPDAPVGTVTLTIEHQGYVPHKAQAITLQIGSRLDLGTIPLSLGGGLYGTVLGPDGMAPASCTLMLLTADGRLPTQYVGGSYRFTGVPAGRHTLLVQGPELASASFAITIEQGVDLPRNIELQQGLHRRVRVIVRAGGGDRVTLAMRVADAPMRWLATAPVRRERTETDGTALFDTWMAAGSYQAVAVTPQGHRAQETVHYAAPDADDVVLHVAPQ